MKITLTLLLIAAYLLLSGCHPSAGPSIRKQPVKQLTAEEWFNRANDSYKKGEYDRAIADYTKALEINSHYTDAYYNRGNAWADRSEYDQAIADYTKALELAPHYADAYFNRGIMWTHKLRISCIFEQRNYLLPVELHHYVGYSVFIVVADFINTIGEQKWLR